MDLVSGFFHPALAAGVLLAGVPILIHLLNRQRHRPVPWAAMRFVLAAWRKTRRRVQLENLLLLLLRAAAVALLALAVARPFTGAASPLAALTESRQDLLLVLDASASTGYREEATTVFERIVARARELVREQDGGRGDRVRLIVAAKAPRLLSWTSPDKALSVLDALTEAEDQPLELGITLAEVRKLVEDEAEAGGAAGMELRLLTDLQRRSFAPPAGEAERAPLSESLDALQALDLRLVVEDLGPAALVPPNVGITAIEALELNAAAGPPSEVRVEVRNYGPDARNGLRVVLYVDGERRPAQTVDLAPRGRAETVFLVSFQEPGEHVLEARLEGDRLAVDDARAAIVRVPSPVRVLLVDGAPAPELDLDEVGYLSVVLEPVADDALLGAPAPFRPRVVRPDDLEEADVELEAQDVIWLANVESLAARTVERLEAWVAGGGALIVSVGDRVVAESANASLFRPDGSGLLPAELSRRVSVPDRRQGWYRVKRFAEEHPALSFFAQSRWRPLLTEVPVYEFLASRPLADARVLAELDDELASPLLIERAYDRGRVFLWTSTIDPAWTRLPESPATLVPLVHELLRYAASPSGLQRNLAPGDALACEVEGFPRSAVLVRPDGTRRAVEGEPEELGGGRYRLPLVPGSEASRAGVWRFEVDARRPQTHSFALRIDPSEGDLERLAPAELGALHPALVLRRKDREGSEEVGRDSPQGELWRWLAALCLAALVGESLWAAWLGRRRALP